jgi:hypothetical protein
MHEERGQKAKGVEESLRASLPSTGGGKNITRRRFFEASLLSGVAVLFGVSRPAGAAVGGRATRCAPNTCEPNVCQFENTCTPNTCADNTCSVINVCHSGNTCTAPDVCSGRNSCTQENRHNNCGGGGNRCNTNFCIGANICATNTCTQNVCQRNNTCQVANNCGPNRCAPSGNSCGPTGNQCNSMDIIVQPPVLPRPVSHPGWRHAAVQAMGTMRQLRRGELGASFDPLA